MGTPRVYYKNSSFHDKQASHVAETAVARRRDTAHCCLPARRLGNINPEVEVQS